MADRFDVKMVGMEELDRKMQKLAKSLGPDNTEPMLYGAAELVTTQVQANVNSIRRVTGNLSRSPVTKMMSKQKAGEPRPSIAAIDRKIAPHAWLVEFGSSKSSPTPYFRPAWDSKRGAALEHIKKELAKAVREGTR